MSEHELALELKKEYAEFYEQFGNLKVPASLRRWHAEVCEMFEHQHEEILYYGED